MSDQLRFPKIVDGEKPYVHRHKMFSINCPNPSCNCIINITTLTEGTKIECPNCKNITWTPSYKNKWWQKLGVYIVSLIISFIIGLCSSLVANYINNYHYSEVEKQDMEANYSDLINN